MKRIVAVILLLVCFMGSAEAELYPRFGNIVDIEYDTDFVTVDDGLGNLWDFMSTPIALWHFYGDLVVMLMDDNETPEWIYDDKVLDAYYCDVADSEEIIAEWREHCGK